ncbi:MAG TPA: T9SS type A sorting domain-containing protein, partial [Ignavibacteriaceae bacterium]
NGILDYPKYRIDSFQMTDAPGSSLYGRIYVDNLRLVKKSIVSGIESDQQTLPNDFVLYQNYPNPFNPSTKIRYTIPAVGTSLMKFVQLKVFDVLGNEVATLVNEYKPTGKYEMEFQSSVDGRQLASGVYYYQLKAGDPSTSPGQSFIQTKKMILVK